MDIKELRQLQAKFENYRNGRAKAYREFESLRKSFIKKYTVQKIKNLSKEELQQQN